MTATSGRYILLTGVEVKLHTNRANAQPGILELKLFSGPYIPCSHIGFVTPTQAAIVNMDAP